MVDILNQTMTCPACKGMGTQDAPDPDSTAGTKKIACVECIGSGAVIDSFVPDAIKKYCPTIERHRLPLITAELNEHYNQKMQDAYERGYRDGKAPEENKDSA